MTKLGLAAGAVGCCVALATAPTATAESTVLIMGGTGEPDPGALPVYMQHMEQYYINPFGPCPTTASCNYAALVTPEQFWPIPGWYNSSSPLTFNQSTYQGVADLESALTALPPDQTVIVFGYSQSGRISTLAMRDIQDGKVTLPAGTALSFVLVGNITRPNGGLWERLNGLYIPILDVTFDGATPTTGPYTVTDVAFQYDGSTDAPEYPINALADVNALLGFYYLHGTYPGVDPADSSPPPGGNPAGLTPTQLAAAEADPANIQVHGNTTYVTIPATTLPIVEPLLQLGTATGTSVLIVPFVDLVQPALRTLIETGYNRSNYGAPTTFQLMPTINPVTLATDLVQNVQEGVTDALSNLGNTTPVPLPPLTATQEPNDTPFTLSQLSKPVPSRVSTAPTRDAMVTAAPTVPRKSLRGPDVVATSVIDNPQPGLVGHSFKAVPTAAHIGPRSKK